MARVCFCALVAVVVCGAGSRAQAPAPPARQGGPGGGQFAGQTPIDAMIITGGCCHDYTGQSKVLMDTLNAVMPINWTVVHGMAALPDGRLPLFDNSNWARGFEIVIHNECWANGDLPAQVVQNITNAAVPRMFFHCALHSYRVMTNDAWRELIGITSRRHTRSHNVMLKWAENDPITAGLPPFVTPIDELYVVEKVWPGTKAIATAVNAVDKGVQGPNEIYPVVWTHEYGGRARVFGTSLGHANETWSTNQFKELVTRGFRWALKKEPIAMPPPARRGSGPARGAAPGGAAAAPETR